MKLKVYSPFIGVVKLVSQVPDPVFAEKLVGDGVAVEPLDNKIYAPVDGMIRDVHSAKHAITFSTSLGVDILLHIGLDSVQLRGIGFNLTIKKGDTVRAGQEIGQIDLDYVSLHARSLITPVLVAEFNHELYDLQFLNNIYVDSTKVLFEVVAKGVSALADNNRQKSLRQQNNLLCSPEIVVSNKLGIHARPAALISNIIQKFEAGDVFLEKNGDLANARSIVAILGLSINFGDRIFVRAQQSDVLEAVTEVIINLDESNSEGLVSNPTNSSTIDSDVVTESSRSSENSQATEAIFQANGSKYFATIASSGICIGELIKKNAPKFSITENSQNIKDEEQKLNMANTQAKAAIKETLNQRNKAPWSREHADILNAHLALLDDPELWGDIKYLVSMGKSAAFSIYKTIDKYSEILANTNNPSLKERQADLLQIRNQLLEYLGAVLESKLTITKDSILLIEELTPNDIMHLPQGVVGIVSVNGGVTSHAAILARSYAIPLLVGLPQALIELFDAEIKSDQIGDSVILNAHDGYLDIKPSLEDLQQVQKKVEEIKINRKKMLQDVHLPLITQDGVKVECLANIINADGLDNLIAHGATGVGLFRTEFIYLDRATPPSLQEQYSVYKNIVDKLIEKDYPLVVRTLDLGGDKVVSYLNTDFEQNPMLGIRGIRLCLQHEKLFEVQLEAILKVNYNKLKIMIPMISDISEFFIVKNKIEALKSRLAITSNVELGIMVEVPSVVFASDMFAKVVDFFSIGTNDLTQYILAVDREHSVLSDKADHLHPSVLKAIQTIVISANKYNKPVSVCGLMATERLAIPVLIGLGVRVLSMGGAEAITENKAFIRGLNIKDCVVAANNCLQMLGAAEVRKYLSEMFN